MTKLTSAFLVATLFLAPVLAAAQTSSGAGGTKAPGSSPTDKPGSSPSGRPTGSPGMGQPTPPNSGTPDPAASPPGADLSRHNTRADCEKAGGKWGEVSQSCTQK